jgi:hypothetical protein
LHENISLVNIRPISCSKKDFEVELSNMHCGFPNPIPNLATCFFSQDNLCHFEDGQHMMCKLIFLKNQMKLYLKLEVEVKLMKNFFKKIYMITNIYYDKVKFLKLVSA